MPGDVTSNSYLTLIEPLNNATMKLNRYFDLFDFRTDESRDVFRDRLKLALSN
jgi:hypothetical protein